MKLPELSLSPIQHRALSLIAVLTILPHGLHFSPQINLYLMLLMIWHLAGLRWHRFRPGRWSLVIATLGGIALVFSEYHTLIGHRAGVALLTVMFLLKVLEVRRRRDLTVTLYIAYFVVVTHFLFGQSIVLAIYLFALMIAATALLLESQRVTVSRHPADPLYRTLVMSLQAVPLALILFVVFPRISHPLWHIGMNSSAMTGMSDRVRPGMISELVASEEVAFRVRFDDTPPAPEQRYWRGLVIWDSDGETWYNRTGSPFWKQDNDAGIAQVHYEIFLEAHQHPWLYSLDLPLNSPPQAILTGDRQLLTRRPVNQPLNYRLVSSTEQRDRRISTSMRTRALALPDNITQRQRDLVEQWKQTSGTDRDLVQQVLNHFHDQPFVYTLTPPLYPDNPIDEFLFEGREGFCEHYATAFTQLMRLAGIPSRLILGYQGAEYNDLGDYFIIRQSDAHAWSEVWLAEQGWVRIDPTAAVAPERIRYSILTDETPPGSPVSFHIDRSGFIGRSLIQITHLLDNANVQWRRWVVGYSREHQFSLMRQFGFQRLTHLEWGIMIAGLIGVIMLVVALNLIRQGKNRPSQVMQSYERFCHNLARVGILRKPGEGPLDYARRASRARPDLSAPISRITSGYIQLRYGPDPKPELLENLQRDVRAFRPGRTRHRV
ncbi:MAG: DUF3488 and transglutaminase-like domain-containing protein [Candidatus Thiodiazotropha sp.]